MQQWFDSARQGIRHLASLLFDRQPTVVNTAKKPKGTLVCLSACLPLHQCQVYEKDCSKLTMRERLAAKARKEDMLRHSGMVPQAPST